MWGKVINVIVWFGEVRERLNVIRSFNTASQKAFYNNETETLLKARISKGDNNYRHSFSKFLAGGFRIKALSGRPLQKREQVEISKVILDNTELVRNLISLGWDTLEVHDEKGSKGIKFPLKEYAKIGGILEN